MTVAFTIFSISPTGVNLRQLTQSTDNLSSPKQVSCRYVLTKTNSQAESHSNGEAAEGVACQEGIHGATGE